MKLKTLEEGQKNFDVEGRWWRKGFGLVKESASLGVKNIQGVKVDTEKILEKLQNKELVFRKRKQKAEATVAATA